MPSADEIEETINRWLEQSDNRSYSSTICVGEAFSKLRSWGEIIYPHILKRLRDESPWLGFQYLLKSISGEDYWQGNEVRGGYRAINVAESAKLWLEWGQLKNLIDNIDPKWDGKNDDDSE